MRGVFQLVNNEKSKKTLLYNALFYSLTEKPTL
jgi:hypothetical protein